MSTMTTERRRWPVWLRGFGVACLTMIAAGQALAEIDDAALANETDGRNWAAFGRTFSEDHYSPLEQINKQNVSKLAPAWTLELPEVWNVSSQPLEVDGTVYFAAGYSRVYAVNAKTGEKLWDYDPKVSAHKMRYAWGIRGTTYYKGRVYTGTQDGRLFALDGKTGQLVWETMTTEPDDNRYITGAPRAFEGKILIGHGGADFGKVRGYVTAYDADTGKQIWRWYAVPGDPSKGFEDKSMEMAAKTWTGEWWKFGAGGTAWNAMTYDPELKRVYIGTGNGGPWNRKLRSPGGGDNLFLCSVVALDANTGEYLWHYQTTPGETWDFNSTMDIELATLEIDGKPRKVLLHAPKNGFFYVIDRESGKLLSAEKIGKVTWADHVDMATGRPVENPGVRYEDGETLMWPGSAGAHNWNPMAYSPDTRLVYIPTRNLPGYYNDIGIKPEHYDITVNSMGLNQAFNSDVPKEAGDSSILAWDPVQQKARWRFPTPGAINGGVAVTKTGLVFQGQADGKFLARDADTGAVLWSYDMGVGTQAPPAVYEVDGKEYVLIPAGWGGAVNTLGTLTAQFGWVGRQHPRRLIAFALDGTAKIPESAPPEQVKPVDDAAFVVDHTKALAGQDVYSRCIICHGVAAVAGGYAPDLRASPVPLSADAFAAIVRDGGLLSRGMPSFPELTDEQLEDLRHYIRERARYKPTFGDQMSAIWMFVRLRLKAEWAILMHKLFG